MLKKIQQDFSYYSHEFKDNYRKGVHRLRTILASRAQAQAFVSNAGGVAVVLGYEPETPDKNAQELYALLAASPYIDDAVQTFLGSIYEARRGKPGRDVFGQRPLSGNPARSGYVSRRRCRHGKRREMDRNSGRTELQFVQGYERGCRQRYRYDGSGCK